MNDTRSIARLAAILLLFGVAPTRILVPGARATLVKASPPPTIEFAEKERRSCVTCHTAFGRAELNEAGEFYKEKGTLDGYPGDLPPREGEEPAPRPRPQPVPERP